jgi:multiple sugar transport system permease protein
MSSTRTLISPATLARPRGKAVYWAVFTGLVLLFAPPSSSPSTGW